MVVEAEAEPWSADLSAYRVSSKQQDQVQAR